MIPQQHRRKAAWFAICVSAVAGFEGLRTVAYRDPVGIPTICFGETRNVRMGDKATEAQCREMLGGALLTYNDAVRKCVHTPMSPQREAGLTSFAYNVGTGAFCSSTLVRRLNAGDPGACDELLKWNKAKGVPLPGLTRRRQEERELCLAG